MVSNSTAALSLSLESSPNLHGNQEVPLAIRRGKKPPPALSLSQHRKLNTSACADSNSYPDIPSAFLGISPTGFSPTTPIFASGELSKFDMGLSAMCSNLKALVPPPPFTPTEVEHKPPSRPPPSLEPETRWGIVTSAQLPDADDEEWGFVQELVVDWHAGKGRRVEITAPPSPPTEVADGVIDAPGAGNGATAPTSTVSQCGDDEPNVDDVSRQSTQSPSCIKQMRRKTVIIQAPDGDTLLASGETDRAAKLDKLSNSTAERTIDLLLDEFDEPVPFEIPSSTPLSAPASLEGLFSTPPNSRPSSTASSAGLPIRGILKEKKSVRFSAVPSLYQYAAGMNDEVTECPGTPSKHHSDLDALSALKRIPIPTGTTTTTRAPHRSSPLRKTQTRPSDSSGSEEDITALLAIASASASARSTVPTTPAVVVVTPPRPPAPTTSRTQTSANGTGAMAKPTMTTMTMAKHPAVRVLALKPSPSRPPVALSPVTGSGVGGAVMGAPGLQSPYPTMSSPPKNQNQNKDQRRTPLRTINVRQNTTVERKPNTTPVKQAPTHMQTPTPCAVRKRPTATRVPSPTATPVFKGKGVGVGEDKENVGDRVSQTASTPNSPDQKHERHEVQDARRRSMGVLSAPQLKGKVGPETRSACGGAPAGAATAGSQKGSRMPVPLRSIFTKLRT